jgi:hypothetical protein
VSDIVFFFQKAFIRLIRIIHYHDERTLFDGVSDKPFELFVSHRESNVHFFIYGMFGVDERLRTDTQVLNLVRVSQV